jgi:hypothetical protein
MFVSCFSLHRWVSMVHAATPSRCKLLQDSVQARNGTGHRSCTRSGWRKPALRNVARSQVENAFPRRHSRVQPGAAGVSQPWYGTRTCNRDANQCAKTGRRCKRESEPRRADTPTIRHRIHPPQGSCKSESEPTAGSRPPLFVVRSLATGQCSILTTQRSYHEPRRADARRSCERANSRRRDRLSPTRRTSCTKSGWRKPALRNVARSQMENAFPRRHSRVQPGAAGVSQPWFGTRTCNRDANQCAKTGRRCKRESEPRWADTPTIRHRIHPPQGSCKCESEPTAGSRPPLFVVRSLATGQCSILTTQRSYHEPRQADARRSCEHANSRRRDRLSPTRRTSCTRSGRRKPALRNVARSQMENAFPRRHSRFQPRAAGVSQPWFGTRTCNRDANQCAKTGGRCKCESEPRWADAVTQPHLHTTTWMSQARI